MCFVTTDPIKDKLASEFLPGFRVAESKAESRGWAAFGFGRYLVGLLVKSRGARPLKPTLTLTRKGKLSQKGAEIAQYFQGPLLNSETGLWDGSWD